MKAKKVYDRPIIGIMSGDILQDYSKISGTLIAKKLTETGKMDVRVFLGSNPAGQFPGSPIEDGALQLHHCSMYQYSRYDRLDMIVLICRSLIAASSKWKMDEFLETLPDVPIIIVGDAAKHPRSSHILTDYYGGFRKLMEHLLNEHGYRRVACVTGPKGSYDADQCRMAYQDAMEDQGCSFRAELDVPGDFPIGMDQRISRFLKQYPDIEALLCANDMIADAAYRAAGEMGVSVGRDIAVTGFDNIGAAKYMSPSLTTVKQDLEALAEAVKDQALAVLSGETAGDVMIPVSVKQGASCGCLHDDSGNAAELTGDVYGMVQWQKRKILRLKQENIFCSMLLRNLFLEEPDEKSFFCSLGKQMHSAGMLRTYLFLLGTPIHIRHDEPLKLPNQLYFMLSQEGAEIICYDRSNAPVISMNGMAGYMEKETTAQLLQFLLFFQDRQYGILFIETDSNGKVPFCHALSLEIGNALRHLEITLEQSRMHSLLQEKNRVLDHAASHDKLTGLYNRAGLLGTVTSYFERYPHQDFFAVLMADMDHLKQVNDTFGHLEGDEAIIATAGILERALPEGSLIGRTGGDEYLCFSHLKYDEEAKEIRERIRGECDAFNASDNRPYYVEVSVGYHVFFGEDKGNLSMMIKIADTELYRDKKNRRASSLRVL